MSSNGLKILKKEDLGKSIGVVVGTRPGIVKFAPVIRYLTETNANFFVIHTGQHYSYNMDAQFFLDLELPPPQYTNKTVRKYKTHGGQTAEMIKAVEAACLIERPAVFIVGGDANTNLASALAVRKLGAIKLAHMEAGLRSNDWRMPEEHNRGMIDRISDILFAPTETAVRNLKDEKVKGRVYLTGNTIVDAVYQNRKIAASRSHVLTKMGLSEGEYFVLTLHREENVDSSINLANILEGIRSVSECFEKPIVFPVHPRTRKRLDQFFPKGHLKAFNGLKMIKPVGYLDFLQLLSHSALVMTDSGGIQEESCILQVPCVTLRENTERPETVQVGSNVIAGTRPVDIVGSVQKMMRISERDWPNPYGDGAASRRIADILVRECD